jgi:hypothetical protein
VPPKITGRPLAGASLAASTGEWTGSPTSFSYQWQACEAGGPCIDLPEATSATYTLIPPEVGFTVRVLVTATGPGGSQTAASEQTEIVMEPAPENTVIPQITGATLPGSKLSASTGEWTGSPTSFSYQWQSCTTLGACKNLEGATSSTYVLATADVGHSVRVLVTATGPGGSQTATSEEAGPVTEPPPPPTVNTALPKISGATSVGSKLSASTGEWSGSPNAYSYEWQSCSGPATCAKIKGATSSTYQLTAPDVGQKIRVLVTADGPGGTATAASEQTAVIVGEAETAPAGETDCFGREEACGYPGPNDTGVANCSALKPSGSKTITKPETVEGEDITGTVVVNAANVTLNNDCVETNGEEKPGFMSVVLEPTADNFTISNSTVRGKNSRSESIEGAIYNGNQDSGDVATKDRFENCNTCIFYAWTVSESYVIANGQEGLDENGTAHTEDWYFSDSTVAAAHDTIYNPSKQTAVIFAASGGPCENHETVTNSLLAGGGFVFYFCQHSTGAGSSSIDIKDNRFARLICTHKEISGYEGRGGFGCTGSHGGYFESGEGSGGYFPRGGFFGLVSEGEGIYDAGVGWEGNYWDNNLEAQPEKAYCPKCG